MEPATTAKVVLHTSKGPIEIELWAKETPLTCRNFIQLCLNGYYDNCKFHRVVKDFIVQSGDPSGTGYGGSSIYETGMFEDEFHSRLKFSKRGMVGSANAGAKNTNGSQFIITLAPAAELNNKNTVFGRIAGDTFYNILKIADGELDDDKPLYPVTIQRAEVVIPYFTDLETPKTAKELITEELSNQLRPKKKKAKVKISYASEEEEEEVDGPALIKIKPAHDLLEDKRLKKEVKPSVASETADTGKSTRKHKRDSVVIPAKGLPSPAKVSQQTKISARKDRETATLEMLKKFQAKMSNTKYASPAASTTATAATNTSSITDNTWNSDDELPSDYEEIVDDPSGLWDHTFQVQ